MESRLHRRLLADMSSAVVGTTVRHRMAGAALRLHSAGVRLSVRAFASAVAHAVCRSRSDEAAQARWHYDGKSTVDYTSVPSPLGGWPTPRPGKRNAGFLDDVGCFSSSCSVSWYSFAQYLLLCRELSLGVALKEGKTDGPRQVLHYFGLDCDMVNGVVSLHSERLQELRAKMKAVYVADSVSVREVLSLVGVLVFCSIVIPLGKTHYHALQDAVVALGRDRTMASKVTVSLAMRYSLSLWSKLLSLLNARSAAAPISRVRVPGEVTTDASLSGWGWAGMGICAAGRWPADWAGRLGRAVAKHPGSDAQLRRIFICECEAWAVLFMVRALIPRCKHCRLMVRVDNLPVVHMLQKLSCRSRACLPIIREISWRCATWDVEIECVWIATADNKLSDALSRRYTSKFDAAELRGLLHEFRKDPVQWDVSWPPQSPARRELFPHIQVAHPADFSSAWGALPSDDLRYIFPRMLQGDHERQAAA